MSRYDNVPETPIQTHRDNSSNSYIEMERAAMDTVSSLDEYPALCELKSLGDTLTKRCSILALFSLGCQPVVSPFRTTLLSTYDSSPTPNPSGLRSIQAMTMDFTLPIASVWSRTTMRCSSSSPALHRTRNSALRSSPQLGQSSSAGIGLQSMIALSSLSKRCYDHGGELCNLMAATRGNNEAVARRGQRAKIADATINSS